MKRHGNTMLIVGRLGVNIIMNCTSVDFHLSLSRDCFGFSVIHWGIYFHLFPKGFLEEEKDNAV